MSDVQELTNETFDAAVFQENKAVLVDFYSPTCGPCQAMMPTLRYLAEDKLAGKVEVYKVNVDKDKDLADEIGVRGLPTLVFFLDGSEMGRMVGSQRSSVVVAALEQAGLLKDA